MRRRWIGLAASVAVLAVAGGAPAVGVALWTSWHAGRGTDAALVVTLAVVLPWLAAAGLARARVVKPLQTLSNLLAALREGDFAVRGRDGGAGDALDAVTAEFNALSKVLQDQRLAAVEAASLLGKVMAAIDVAIFAFDPAGRLALINLAAERLTGRTPGVLLGRPADELGLTALLAGPTPRLIEHPFAHGTGPYELRRATFRQAGLPHRLLVLTDLGRPLREREREAWQKLVRVLGHEINNSLTPICSIASQLSASARVAGDSQTARGLEVIARRSESLARFLSAYTRLARLPPPSFRPLAVDECVARVVELEKRLDVTFVGRADVVVEADVDQVEQLLINVLRNAVDAALPTRGRVEITSHADRDQVVVEVHDEGPGIADTANLFVPFFTTKAEGSGIGLALGRQIAEAHGGRLTLENRVSGRGCVASLTLPRARRVS